MQLNGVIKNIENQRNLEDVQGDNSKICVLSVPRMRQWVAEMLFHTNPFLKKLSHVWEKKVDYVVTTISVILEHSLSVYDVTKNWKRNMEGFHTILHQIEVCKPEQFQRVRLDNR